MFENVNQQDNSTGAVDRIADTLKDCPIDKLGAVYDKVDVFVSGIQAGIRTVTQTSEPVPLT